jgi:hypothetical protein
MEVVMQHQGNTGRDGAPTLSLVGDVTAREPRDASTERDVLARLAEEIDRGIADLPAGSPWRPWLAKWRRVIRAGAGLALAREALPKEVG